MDRTDKIINFAIEKGTLSSLISDLKVTCEVIDSISDFFELASKDKLLLVYIGILRSFQRAPLSKIKPATIKNRLSQLKTSIKNHIFFQETWNQFKDNNKKAIVEANKKINKVPEIINGWENLVHAKNIIVPYTSYANSKTKKPRKKVKPKGLLPDIEQFMKRWKEIDSLFSGAVRNLNGRLAKKERTFQYEDGNEYILQIATVQQRWVLEVQEKPAKQASNAETGDRQVQSAVDDILKPSCIYKPQEYFGEKGELGRLKGGRVSYDDVVSGKIFCPSTWDSKIKKIVSSSVPPGTLVTSEPARGKTTFLAILAHEYEKEKRQCLLVDMKEMVTLNQLEQVITWIRNYDSEKNVLFLEDVHLLDSEKLRLLLDQLNKAKTVFCATARKEHTEPIKRLFLTAKENVPTNVQLPDDTSEIANSMYRLECKRYGLYEIEWPTISNNYFIKEFKHDLALFSIALDEMATGEWHEGIANWRSANLNRIGIIGKKQEPFLDSDDWIEDEHYMLLELYRKEWECRPQYSEGPKPSIKHSKKGINNYFRSNLHEDKRLNYHEGILSIALSLAANEIEMDFEFLEEPIFRFLNSDGLSLSKEWLINLNVFNLKKGQYLNFTRHPQIAKIALQILESNERVCKRIFNIPSELKYTKLPDWRSVSSIAIGGALITGYIQPFLRPEVMLAKYNIQVISNWYTLEVTKGKIAISEDENTSQNPYAFACDYYTDNNKETSILQQCKILYAEKMTDSVRCDPKKANDILREILAIQQQVTDPFVKLGCCIQALKVIDRLKSYKDIEHQEICDAQEILGNTMRLLGTEELIQWSSDYKEDIVHFERTVKRQIERGYYATSFPEKVVNWHNPSQNPDLDATLVL